MKKQIANTIIIAAASCVSLPELPSTLADVAEIVAVYPALLNSLLNAVVNADAPEAISMSAAFELVAILSAVTVIDTERRDTTMLIVQPSPIPSANSVALYADLIDALSDSLSEVLDVIVIVVVKDILVF